MRTRLIATLSALLILTLLLPQGAAAKRVTAGGSITITKGDGSPLAGELVVTLVTLNPGIEKTIAQQYPLPGPIYVGPFFVNQDNGNPQNGDLDTFFAMVNLTGAALSIKITIRMPDGDEFPQSPVILMLQPHETRFAFLSDLLS
jgi:hypothetical protein